MNELPEHEPDEPPHPPFRSKKWLGRRESDELLVFFMEWYNLDPDEFRNRKSRYQYVKVHGKFRCFAPNCLKENGERSFWTSKLACVRFDMHKQTVRLYGQKCKKCRGSSYGNRYCYPLAFKYLEWRDACLKGLDRAFRDRYLRDDVLDENIDEGAFCYMNEEEQQNFLESIVPKEPHQRELCQRCK